MRGTEGTKGASSTRLPEYVINFLSGGIAGTTAKTAIAPLERVKILFQIRHQKYPFTSVTSTIHKISLREGVLALWKGNGATVVRIFPYAALQFMSYEKYKTYLRKTSLDSNLQNLLAGSAAGTTSVVFTYPLDLIRVRLAISVDKKHYDGIAHAFTSIFRQEGGVLGLYRGVVPTLLGIVPYAGTNFAAYEYLKKVITRVKQKPIDQISVYDKLACGAIAGCIGQTVAYPLDVVRRQMQTHGFAEGHGHYHNSTWEALTTIYLKEGIYGLFKGLSINYLKAGPSVAISFTTYEFMKKKLASF